MKIEFNPQTFASVYQLAAMVAPQRSPKAILQNVRMEATSNDLVLVASDMELSIRINAPDVTIHRPGVIIVPVSRFSGLLREVTDSSLVLEVVGDSAIITGATSRFQLPLKDPDEFPTVDVEWDGNYWETESRILKEVIRRTAFAADSESTRYALSGVLLELQSDELMTAVATDGRRLAKMDAGVKVHGNVNRDQTTIVPTKTMLLIEKMLPDDEQIVQLSATANEVRVRVGGGVIISRLVEGRYPKWKDAIPSNRDSLKLDILVGTLYTSLRQAAVVADEETRGVDMSFTPGSLVVNSQAAEVGQARIEVPISYEGPEVNTALDLRYLSDMLKFLPADKLLTMDIEGPMTAAYFKTDDSFGYVIMPLTRNNKR